MANTQWNVSDKSATVALSLLNLRATVSGGFGGARGVASNTAGKYYWEYVYTTIFTNNINPGIALSSGSLTAPSAGVVYVSRSSGNIFVNGSSSGSSLGTIPASSVLGVAVDFTAQQIWFRLAPAGNWNGSGTANPATPLGGVSISAVSSGPLFPYMTGNTSDVLTANFGDSAFTGAVPAGFTSGFSPGGGAGGTTAIRVMVLA